MCTGRYMYVCMYTITIRVHVPVTITIHTYMYVLVYQCNYNYFECCCTFNIFIHTCMYVQIECFLLRTCPLQVHLVHVPGRRRILTSVE